MVMLYPTFDVHLTRVNSRKLNVLAASQKDIERKDVIKENLVPGLKVGKSGI